MKINIDRVTFLHGPTNSGPASETTITLVARICKATGISTLYFLN